MNHSFSRSLALSLLAAVFPFRAAFAGTSSVPEILKVDPPSWWAGHSINPVRLLIRGRGLAGATIAYAGADLHLSSAQVNAAGTYLFVDARIEPTAQAGKRRLAIKTADGRAEAEFEILKALPPKGRFAGVSSSDLLYLLMPDRFANGDTANDNPPAAPGMVDRTKTRYYHGGDLQGVINHLPYLKDLGVTAVWMTPVYANHNRLYPVPFWSPEHYTDYHGYGPEDYYSVDPHLGDLAKLRELTDAAHALGMKVLFDQVANHTGPEHPWVKDPPTPTWYNGSTEKHLSNTFQKWLLADPYATADMLRPVMEGWYYGVLPDLNQNDPEVARYLTQNMIWWIGVSGADGLRQDTLYFAPRSFWKDCLAAIKREYPSLSVLGEVYGDDPALVSYYQGGKTGFDGIDTGLDIVFDFPLMKTVRSVFVDRKPAEDLAAALSRDRLYPNPQNLVTLLGSQDESRFMGLPGAGMDGLKLAYAFLLTTRGIPLIYSGDEIAMRGGNEPDNRRDFPGGWRGDAHDAFAREKRTAEEEDVFDYVRSLARLRAELEPLRAGKLVNLSAGEQTYAYGRYTDSAGVVVVLNTGSKTAAFDFDRGPLRPAPGTASLKDRLGSAPDARIENGRIKVDVAPRSAAVYSFGGR
ncbi:MAG: alpha-amylase family glycosyl hydrolase [Elusimicrobiota bacterium]